MVTQMPATTPVYSRGLQLGAEGWCEVVACGDPELVLHVLGSLWLGVVTAFALAALVYVREARPACETERRRARTERDAFQRFSRRVADVEATATGPADVHHGAATLVRTDAADDGLRRVRDAYGETVMAVPHYDEEYDESMVANMSAEFGEEVATAVAGGAAFTPQLKHAVVAASDESRRQRAGFVRALARERDALSAAGDRLGGVDAALDGSNATPLSRRSFDDLAALDDRLRDLEASVAGVVRDRQAAVRGGYQGRYRRHEGHEFLAYLYRDLPVTYPVLADAASLLDDLATARRRVVRALTARA